MQIIYMRRVVLPEQFQRGKLINTRNTEADNIIAKTSPIILTEMRCSEAETRALRLVC